MVKDFFNVHYLSLRMVSSIIFIFLCVTLSTSNSFKTPENVAVNDEKSLSINVNDESILYPAVSDESSLSFEWTGPMSMRVRNRDGDEDDIELRPAQGIGNVHVECLFVGYLVKDTNGGAGVVGCQQSIQVDITIVSIYSPGTMFILFNENKTTLELLDTPAINDDSDGEEEEFKRSKRSSFYEDGDTYVYDDDDDDKLDYDDGNGTDYVYTDGDFAYDGAKTPKSIPPSVYYEFALSYDEAFLTKMNQNTTEAEKYITIVATLAQTYFKHSSLGTIIHFVMNKNIRYLRGKEFMIDPLGLSEKLNITDAIKDITSKEPLIIFTKTDDSEFWRGIASMRRACNATLGRAIIKHRKEFLRAAITMAHEMGHLFGNFHDGIADERNARSKKRINTSCRGTGIMSESDNRPEVWSVCSHQRLAKWFKKTGHACLKTASACDNDDWVKDVPCSCGVGNKENLCSILNEEYCVSETATCIGTLRTSTNFPNNYPHNENTEQTMSVPEGFSVLVTFVDFQIEDNSDCLFDYVQICDQNKNCGRKLCGTSLPDPVTTLTSTATVVFHSDSSASRKGFRLFYQKTDRKDSFWSEWSQWSSCSRTCGGGSQTRIRSCSNLGNCKGSSTDTRTCSTDSCPRVWGEWSQWSSCSPTCGRGSQTKRRSCTTGSNCQGDSLIFRMCSSFSSCSRVWCWNKLRKRCIPGRRRSYSSGRCTSSENECKQLQEWSGIQTKIWGDDQCKSLGQGNVGLEDCMAICVKTPTCTAINYNRYEMHCVLRECTQHLQTPQLQSDNYRGYYYLKRKRNACGRRRGHCVVGRPFFVDGKSRTTISQAFHDGPSKRDESWKVGNFPSVLTNDRYNEDIGHYWLQQAEAEHASVASFARHTLQLMSIGAPARLLEASQQAGIDEIKHAKICYGIATAFIGADITPGVLDVSGSLESMGIKEIIRSVIIDGCIGETLSAIEAHFAAYICKDISVKAALTEIATDETRHGQLAWDTIQWIVKKFPEHRIFIGETFEAALGQEMMPAGDDTQLLPVTSLCEDSGRDTDSHWYGPDMMAVRNDTDSLHTRAFCQDSKKDDLFHWFGLLVSGDRDRVRRVGIRDVIQPVYRGGFKHVGHISKRIIELDLAKI